MKNSFLLFILVCSFLFISSAAFCDDDISRRIENDYIDLIDKHVEKLTEEYGASTESETLLVRRAVKNYIIADLVDYTMLIFMAKYNVATGGIEMKRANAEIISTLKDLSESANNQMLKNINALRSMKGLSSFSKGGFPLMFDKKRIDYK